MTPRGATTQAVDDGDALGAWNRAEVEIERTGLRRVGGAPAKAEAKYGGRVLLPCTM